MADAQAVQSALDTLSRPGDKAAFAAANTWLQDFQHSNEAWATCNVLLRSQGSSLQSKIFAAQTFRTKVIYDLNQLDQSFIPPLRDTLVAALESLTNGPKIIVVQLSLALSGLALQFPEWQSRAVTEMIEKFGQNPATVPTLLEFLRILPEEITANARIPVTNEEFANGSEKLLTANAAQVTNLLAMYIGAQGVTTALQSQIFDALRSWIIAGEVTPSIVAGTPLLEFAFQALDSDELFDAAVDLLCDIIHETQEIDDNMPVIEQIVPRLVQLKPMISVSSEDPDKVKGLAKIFSEAGECYRMLILDHTETFFPIVEAIGECAAYHDLDVVPITFQFWMRLAMSMGKKSSVSPAFYDAYRTLMGVMIKHLHFPADSSTMNPQEADDFRQFRHIMGDTLKDCCYVLGTDNCIAEVVKIISRAIADGNSGKQIVWQDIEAPLFSLRSMGAEVDPRDDKMIPQIMDLLPSLPDHPRVLYAALLVIARYSEWTRLHPSYIPFQLQFVSNGYQSSDSEVTAAASHAMVYLCMDCKQDMIPFLPQLHSFLTSLEGKIIQEDKMRLYEAVAHVISAMPLSQASESLKTFSAYLLAQIQATVSKSSPSKEEIQIVADSLENLEAMLGTIERFTEELPPGCQVSCEEGWAVLDALLSKFSVRNDLGERCTRVLRAGLRFFGRVAQPVATTILGRMSMSFEATGYASYVWIAGKIISSFSEEDSTDMYAAVLDAYERSTSKVLFLLQVKQLAEIPDVLEDYLHMILELFQRRPDILLGSPAFPSAIRIAVASLTLIHSEVIFASLDIIRGIIAHDALDPSISNAPPKFLAYAMAIRQVVEAEGPALMLNLLNGLVHDFPEESVSLVVTIFRMLCVLMPQNFLLWFPDAVNNVPMAASFTPAKDQLLRDVTMYINRNEFDKVKKAVQNFHRFAMRSKDRQRKQPLDTD